MFLRPSHGLLAASFVVLLAGIPASAGAAPTLQASSPGPANSEHKALLSVLPPLCDGVPCWNPSDFPEPQGIGLRRVYLNFEGATLTASSQADDATTNRSYIITSGGTSPGNTLTIGAFNRFDLSYDNGLDNRQQIIDYTVQKMREYHAPYNLEFTTTRPASGQYNMIVFGGSCGPVAGESCAGIALLDCTDASPSNIVFAFPAGLQAVDLATTATQELAHALGLKHTLDTTDFMYPFIQDTLPTHYGEGPIPNKDQTDCGGGSYQDSHEKMLSIVGFPGEDATPPSVIITSPSNGEVVKFGDSVTSTVDDGSPISKVEFSLNNVLFETKTSPPYNFQIPSTSPVGQVRIDVRATDDQGNEAGHKVNVTIGTGNEDACDNGQCDDGFECVDLLCYPDAPVNTGALGEFCSDSESCDSGVCAELEAETRCSQTCSVDVVCPEGFECLGDTACWPQEDSGGGGGDSGLCSIARPGAGMMSSLALLFFAVMFGRRRRRS
ncbi:MAG: hypothetical protein GY811_15425 [Myxococcales bacterium]|nr:hypothetical protein [Myxococcales bacterium]